MRPDLAVTTALLLLLGTGVAKAANSLQLAETAGFHDGECRHDWTFPAPYVGSVVWSGVKGDERAICIRSPDSVGIGHPPVPTVFAAVCTWRQAIR